MPRSAPITLNVWLAHAGTTCDEHSQSEQPAHEARYCLTFRKERGRAVVCVCRAGLLDAIDRLLGVAP